MSRIVRHSRKMTVQIARLLIGLAVRRKVPAWSFERARTLPNCGPGYPSRSTSAAIAQVACMSRKPPVSQTAARRGAMPAMWSRGYPVAKSFSVGRRAPQRTFARRPDWNSPARIFSLTAAIARGDGLAAPPGRARTSFNRPRRSCRRAHAAFQARRPANPRKFVASAMRRLARLLATWDIAGRAFLDIVAQIRNRLATMETQPSPPHGQDRPWRDAHSRKQAKSGRNARSQAAAAVPRFRSIPSGR